MARIFAVTVTDGVVKPDATGRGAAAFTVTNATARPLRGVLRLRPLDATEKAWLSIAGEPERDFSANGTQQVTVRVAVPAGTPAGKYGFRLDVLSATNPDEDYTEGPTVALEVKPSEAPAPKPFPWWIAAVVALVVLAGGGAALYVLLPRTVAVPNVVGNTEPRAEKILADGGFASTKTVERVADVRPGTVIRQQPPAGTKVKPGATVALTIAVPPAPPPPTKIPVPRVKGAPVLFAVEILKRANLKPTVNQMKTTDASVIGKVVVVSPQEGTPVDPDTPIDLAMGVAEVRPWANTLSPEQRRFLLERGVVLK